MTLQKAQIIFKGLLANTTKRAEIKVYQEFIRIIQKLENKSLSNSELETIEQELDSLGLNDSVLKSIKHYKKALQQLKMFLKEKFSLIHKGYYINLGIVMGSGIGLLVGIVFLSELDRSMGISLGISFGTLAGLLIARHLESEAKASGNLI